MPQFHSPLRYPGGKRKLANYVKLILRSNNLLDSDYLEPYAGGAAIALSLLFSEYVRKIHINDIDKSIYSFWFAVLNHPDQLSKMIWDTTITMQEWEKQRQILFSHNPEPLELAFSTFFLNRTNRSGIISGGVIGGKSQEGKWKIDARFNKSELIKRIKKISRYRSRISLTNFDATEFLDSTLPNLKTQSLVYLDPPYYVKGKEALYTNFYDESDHKCVAEKVYSISHPWIISYDNVKPISDLYSDYRSVSYDLSYSAQIRYLGKEIMIFSDGLLIPDVAEPSKIKSTEFKKYFANPSFLDFA